VKEAVVKEAPGWADESSRDSEPTTQDVEKGTPRNSTAGSERGTTEFIIEKETLEQMQKWHIAVRVFYMVAAILMCTAAVLSLQNQTNLGLVFFGVYTIFFSTMICCFEFALNVIARLIAVNFGFMYTLTGRLVFLLFVGFMSFSLSLFGKIAMGILYAAGLFHVFVMFKFPRFEEYLRKKHYYEGKNFKTTR